MKNEPIWSTVGQDLDDASLNRVLAQYRMNPNNLADLKPKNLGNGEQRISYNPNTGNWRIEKRKI